MKMGLVGQKLGMTRLFYEDGSAVAVTVVKVKLNVISQIKLQSIDGYDAVQVAVGEKKKSHLNRSEAGHFAKANIAPGFLMKEFRLAEGESSRYSIGDVLDVTLFSEGQRVDVQGKSVGKGFAGTIKRHHFSGQRRTHGNSLSHRVPGSIGQNQTPGRVFRGKRMSGHLGNVTCSIQHLEIAKINAENNLLLIKGAIPGSKGGYVVIRPSIKS